MDRNKEIQEAARLGKKAAFVAEGRSHLWDLALCRGRGWGRRRGGFGFAAAAVHDEAGVLVVGHERRVGGGAWREERVHLGVQCGLGGGEFGGQLARATVAAAVAMALRSWLLSAARPVEFTDWFCARVEVFATRVLV